jgi:ParB family chromosome partitioning protein
VAEAVAPEPAAEAAEAVLVDETAPVVETPEAVAEAVTPEPAAEAAEAVLVDETAPVVETPEAVAEAAIPEPVAGLEAATAPDSPEAYIVISVDEVVENPLRLRVATQSDELVESVRQHGILQPLVVTPMTAGKFMVLAGNRRLEAARLAGLERIPAVVRLAVERDFLELALIENIQRVNLDPLELAEAYHLLVENFGLSPETIAVSIGKSCQAVHAALNLLKLTDEGKQALQEKSISEGHARALVTIELPALQNNALVYVLENRLGVRQTEDLVRIILNAVAVSRSYDESYQAETLTVAPWEESAPNECTDETVVEVSETDAVVEPELIQAEPETVVETVTGADVAQAVVEVTVENSEPAVALEAQANPESALEQAPESDLSVETAELVVEQTAGVTDLEDGKIDFSWLVPTVEAEGQVQQEEEVLEVTAVEIPTEPVLAVANCDAARDMAIQAKVAIADPALSPALETESENLADVIEEIVQFTTGGDSPLAETEVDQPTGNPEAVAQLDCPEPAIQEEAEAPEVRTQLKGLEAIAVYKRVVENNPGNVRIWHLLGNLYSDLGQYEEAVDCLKRTVELDPDKYTYYYHLGLTLAIARRYPEAIQALEKTIELAPQHILAHCSLAGCYRRVGNETDAQKHIEIARPKLGQEKAYNRACFESISGNSDQAIELLRIALSTDKTPVEWLLRDPDLDFIREDPRFQALVAEQTLPD